MTAFLYTAKVPGWPDRVSLGWRDGELTGTPALIKSARLDAAEIPAFSLAGIGTMKPDLSSHLGAGRFLGFLVRYEWGLEDVRFEGDEPEDPDEEGSRSPRK